MAGDGELPIEGYGKVDIVVNTPEGAQRKLALTGVALCQGIPTNLVSLRRLREEGIYWDTRPKTTLLRRSDGTPLCVLEERYHQFVLEYRPGQPEGAFVARHNSWTPRKASKAPAEV